MIAAVGSIYAYDAHLEKQNLELDVLTWVPPAPPEAAPEIVRNTIRPAADNSTTPVRSTRTELIDSTANPNNPPRDIGTIASNVPPARRDSVIGTMNADPITPPGTVNAVPQAALAMHQSITFRIRHQRRLPLHRLSPKF